MKRLILAVVTVSLLCGVAFGLTPPEDPLTLLPQPKEDEAFLYLEVNNVPFFLNILEGQWFHNFLVNLGEAKEEDIVTLRVVTGSLRSFVKEASIIVYAKSSGVSLTKERKSEEHGFIILHTNTNPKTIAKALNIKLEEEENLSKFKLGEDILYAYLSERYVILSDNKLMLKRLIDPRRLKLSKTFKAETAAVIPKHEKSDLYAFIKTQKGKSFPQEYVEVFGRSEKQAFVLDVNVREGGRPIFALPTRPLYAQVPGKGKPILLGALPMDGRAIVTLLKENLPQDITSSILISLSITEEELAKLLTGRLYLVVGGESKAFEVPTKGLYLYFISDLPQEEISSLFKKVMGGAMGNLGAEGTIKIDHRPGWDALCTSNLPIDLIFGLRGREIIIGVISFDSLNSKVELPTHIEDIFKRANLPFLYINIDELRGSLNNLVELIRRIFGEEDAKEAQKILFAVPPWREIIIRSFDQRRGEIRIIF